MMCFRSYPHKMRATLRQSQGFTLVEMAIVMVILGFLLAGLMMPLSSQRDLAKRKQAEQQLQEIHDALIGFAISQSPSRLPCAAIAGNGGLEDPVGGSNCGTYQGVVPARTLGLNGNFDAAGDLLDPWNRVILYNVTDVGGGVWTTDIQLNAALPDLEVCSDAACATPLADTAVVTLISQGDDLTNSPAQQENTDGDARFVSTTLSEGAGSEFDDIVLWLSPNAVTLQLVKSGRLD